MGKIVTINPNTEEILNEYEELKDNEISEKISKSSKAFNFWSKIPISRRCEYLRNLSEVLLKQKEKLARLVTTEMGKPIKQSYAEIEKCAWVCRYYAENAEEQLRDIEIKTEWQKSFVTFQPLGPILAIMPWNFPFWQVFRFAAPNLAAGNTALLKHSSNTMGCAIEIENIILEAGIPEGVFQNLVISSRKVQQIIENPEVKAVTLTGSTPVGKEVAKVSGWNLKKTVLELGGSDPYVVLKDADIEKTVDVCVTARLINNGQSCIAAKRFIVEKPIFKDFVDLFVEKIKSKRLGDPLDESVDIGPLARNDLRLDLDGQVKRSVEKGDVLVYGGEIPKQKGFFYQPTVIIVRNPESPVFVEETFGPVAALISAENEEEAIDLANRTNFGLGAAVFTSDIEKGTELAKTKLNAGCCFVNDFVKSDPRLPFGGVKESGYGRELSIFGIREFVNIKTVCVK
ncbi:MAG: NAD-dependent succinate-semialdehyde dehydrogenase [Candidatus Kapaibacterium sp.]|nr:MAG: NAD-dependent succinate-semialdehyde dehydrogenase [Candidatus Kapabacteria bacterium]